MTVADKSSTRWLAGRPVLREFLVEQAPLSLGVFALALLVSYLVYGYLPDAEHPLPVAGIIAPIWHMVWMGFWTGYTMAVVGQASGTFSLAYSASIFQFNSISLSPTSLLITFINPFGALLGFWRERQWNLDMALWLCVGALLGAPLGPFIRVTLLSDPTPFKACIGIALLITAIQLWIEISPWYLRRAKRQRAFKEKFDQIRAGHRQGGRAAAGLPGHFSITTTERTWRHVKINYWGQDATLPTLPMLLIGFGVGVAGSALGIGGGFLLVPILVIAYGLPMYVVVAASIPYVIVLSAIGLLSYLFLLPSLTGIPSSVDWSFGLFVASGAVFGAWLAAKTQKYIPESYLKPMLGTITGIVGGLYVINYFYRLPFVV